MWNNWLAGVINPNVYRMAAKIQAAVPLTLQSGLGKIWSTEELIKVMREHGVIDRGWVGADITRTIDQQLGKATFIEKLGRENTLVKFGFKEGQGIENNARAAHF